MVSVEAAIATGSLVAVLALILATMSAVLLQVRCVDAAAEAARLGSRGDTDAARRAAARLVPGGAAVTVETRGDDVTARVSVAPVGSALPGLRVSAVATAAREPDTVAAADPGTGSGAGAGGGAEADAEPGPSDGSAPVGRSS